LLVLVVAIALGLWLGWRIGRPLDDLREAVIERTHTVVSTTPIEIEGDDEFAELAKAFNVLLSAVEEHRVSQEEFIADMAHEVKNPVAAIRAAAESLERKELTPERAERIARILKNSSKRLDDVVTRFLELARAQAGLPKVHRAPFDLGELATRVVENLESDERYQSLTLTPRAAAIMIDGSSEHIETCIRNLVQNAASFAQSTVEVEVLIERDQAVLTVSDDGPGISAEDQKRVFDRFFTRRDDGGGTGLGLAMVQAICLAHGGIVEVESEPGDGSKFRMKLPTKILSSKA